MKKIELALIGAGDRGLNAYSRFAEKYPDEVSFVAVAEPVEEKRTIFSEKNNIPADFRFESWQDLLSKPKFCDGVIISTPDKLHYEPVKYAMKQGYHVLLEKPMATTVKECIEIGDLEKKYKSILMVCHVLRYTPFFSTVKQLLEENRIGKIISVQHNENVCYWHQAHSFVRGHFRNSKTSNPMILAKSCHDMDLLHWLVGQKCTKVSSFGSLLYFKKENAPAGSTERCIEGCKVEKKCPYSALKLYLGENTNWPTSVISLDKSLEARIKALKEGPWGRCVFRCDNDVVDHQVVNLEFENGATVAFTMCAFTHDMSRTIKIMGTDGEIRGHLEKNEIEIHCFNAGNEKTETIILPPPDSSHGGGDFGIMRYFLKQIRSGRNQSLTSAKVSVESHLMAFAAEESRITNKTIFMNEFMNKVS